MCRYTLQCLTTLHLQYYVPSASWEPEFLTTSFEDKATAQLSLLYTLHEEDCVSI